MTKQTEPETKRKSCIAPPFINVTPMIDVLLVLLIIFMVIAPTRHLAKFETKTPEKPDGKLRPPEPTLFVTIGQGSGLSQKVDLNSRPMELPELTGVLKPLLAERTDKTVYLKAPKLKSYGDVATAIDAIKGAGAAPIALQIDYLQ